MKKTFIVIAACLLLLALGSLAFAYLHRLVYLDRNWGSSTIKIPTESYCSNGKFDSDLWKYNNVRTDCPSTNICMLDGLIQRYGLVNMSRFELHDLLGPQGTTMTKAEEINLGGGSCTDCLNWSLELEYKCNFPYNLVPLFAPIKRYRVVLHRCTLPVIDIKTQRTVSGFKCTREDYPWIDQQGVVGPFKTILRKEGS